MKTDAKMSLGDAIAISMTGEMPPHASEEQRAFLAMLHEKSNANWRPWHSGGGCWGLNLTLKGDVMALMTNGDFDFPADEGEWTFSIMEPWGDELFGASNCEEFGRDGVPLADCFAKVEEFLDSPFPGALCVQVHDRATAETWIEALHEAGMGFHFDDNPADIVWDDGISLTEMETALLGYQVLRLREVEDWGLFECPIGYLLAVEACADTTGAVGDDTVAGELRSKIIAGTIPGYERLLPKGE